MNKYQTRFFTNLKKSYESQEDFYPDITLLCIADDLRLPCHRLVLATSSEYFKNVFSWSSGDVIEVHNNISGEVLSIILKYIYSGDVTLTLQNASDILCAANYLNLLEIVEDCVTFLLKNIEMTTCLDMLQLAYQLDLSKFINGTLTFVANNFSNILENSHYKTNLNSLPTRLLIELLKSDELVTRNSETGLCTRPVEREKHIIDFILSYCKDLRDKSVFSIFLPAVRWPLLTIFDEEEYVFKKLIPHLDESKGKKELEDLLDVKFTDWFSSEETIDPTEEDKLLYCTRAYSCSELIPLAAMASSSQINISPEMFTCDAAENECLRALSIVLRLCSQRTIVGGIGLTFSSNGKTIHKHVGVKPENGTSVKYIALEKDEHIVEVHGSSGLLVDNLLFKTSKNKTHGPFGGDGGDESNLMETLTKYRENGGYGEPEGYQWYTSIAPGPHKRIPLDSVLVGITGRELTNEEDLAINNLSFNFRAMLPSPNFLISSKKKCEITITDCILEFLTDMWANIDLEADFAAAASQQAGL